MSIEPVKPYPIQDPSASYMITLPVEDQKFCTHLGKRIKRLDGRHLVQLCQQVGPIPTERRIIVERLHVLRIWVVEPKMRFEHGRSERVPVSSK